MTSGETFLLPGLDDHLSMVISDPTLDRDRGVVVFFLTWQPHHEQACIVHAGEHPFVTHETCVCYRDARVEKDATLERLRAGGQMKQKASLSPALLDRIRRSAEYGDMPTEAYAVLREQGFVA